MPSGGKREGAGRKALAPEEKKVRVVAWVTPETKARIEEEAKRRGQKIGQLLEENF